MLARPIGTLFRGSTTLLLDTSRSLKVSRGRAPSFTAQSLHTTVPLSKSRRSQATEPAPPAPDDVSVIRTKGKGNKGASTTPRGTKSKRGNQEEEMSQDDSRSRTTTTDSSLPDERFDEDGLKTNMERAVRRCRETISQMVGGHGRADPALLDNVKITFSGPPNSATGGRGNTSGESTSGSVSNKGPQSYSLKDFATVGIRDGALIVTCFDADSLKQVERAIYASDLGLIPQQIPGGEEGVLRVPVPRPTAETRAQLVKDINRVCENARVSIRSARHSAQKQIKADEKSKVVGSSEAAKEMKKMEDETKKRAAEIELLYEQAQKRIEQG